MNICAILMKFSRLHVATNYDKLGIDLFRKFCSLEVCTFTKDIFFSLLQLP
jgi:hypothetical protein